MREKGSEPGGPNKEGEGRISREQQQRYKIRVGGAGRRKARRSHTVSQHKLPWKYLLSRQNHQVRRPHTRPTSRTGGQKKRYARTVHGVFRKRKVFPDWGPTKASGGKRNRITLVGDGGRALLIPFLKQHGKNCWDLADSRDG